jgi:hypothetical protein
MRRLANHGRGSYCLVRAPYTQCRRPRKAVGESFHKRRLLPDISGGAKQEGRTRLRGSRTRRGQLFARPARRGKSLSSCALTSCLNRNRPRRTLRHGLEPPRRKMCMCCGIFPSQLRLHPCPRRPRPRAERARVERQALPGWVLRCHVRRFQPARAKCRLHLSDVQERGRRRGFESVCVRVCEFWKSEGVPEDVVWK